MHEKLTQIIAQKKREVDALMAHLQAQPNTDFARFVRNPVACDKQPCFKTQLQKPGLSVIAEIKRASPALGDLAPIHDVQIQAQKYIQAGAAAISVLTDETFFKGHLQDLQDVATLTAQHDCAVLRKDFIIDPLQILQAAFVGADAILLIASVVGDRLTQLMQLAADLKLSVLLEVHDEADLALALATQPTIIGVNNRNLNTFAVDMQQALRLAEHIPADQITVAESGIDNPAVAAQYALAGYDAVLVGQALVLADDPSVLIQAINEVAYA